jgi:hypothetical protein
MFESLNMFRLSIGLLVVFALMGWLLISGNQTQTSSSKTVTQESASVPGIREFPFESSPVASFRSSDIQAGLSPNGNLSIDLPSAANPVSAKNSAVASQNSIESAGKVFPKQISGSTAGSSNTGAPVSSAGSGAGAIREINIPVPVGAKVPALFQDDTPKPLQQMKALDRIASEFEQNVRETPEGMTQEEVWEAARLIADERYMTLFGYQAFNQYHIKAAKEALKEKRANSKVP